MKIIRNVVESLVTELYGKRKRRRFGAVCTIARQVDACENRILPALMTIPLKEFGGVHPTEHTDVNGTLFFVNDSFGTSGPVQLWKSDGTAAGTQIVKTLRTIRGSFPGFGHLTNHNGTLYFAADDGVSGLELWKSDGTAAGTVRVKDITPGVEGTSVGELVSAGSLLYFHATVGSAQSTRLYRTDGTAAGTYPVPSLGNSFVPLVSQSIGDRLLVEGSIPGTPGTPGTPETSGLWAVSATGATPISTFSGAWPPRSDLRAGARIGNKLLFNRIQDDPINPTNELWTSDGTVAGTTLVKSLSGSIVEMDSAGASVYFVTQNSALGSFNSDTQLWRSDGTASGTVQLRNFGNLPRTPFEAPLGDARVVGSNLFFLIKNLSGDTEVWRSTGTSAGTTRLKTVKTAEYPSTASYGGKFYFLSPYGEFNVNLFWSSDGTANGTQIVEELTPSVIESYPYDLVPVGQSLYVLSSEGTSRSLHFAKKVALTPPVLTQPVAVTAEARPIVRWNAVRDATGYNLWVQTAESDDAVLLANVKTTSFRFTEPPGIGTHYLWVSSEYGDNLFSDFSPPRAFRVNTAVTPKTPAANQSTLRPVLQWYSLPGAQQYEVVVDNLTTGQDTVARKLTTDSEFAPAADLPMGRYQFRVRGIDNKGSKALWSAYRTFTVLAPPALIGPVRGGFNTRPEFRWSAVPGATTYQLQLKNRAGAVIHDVRVSQTRWTPPAKLASDDFKWTVRAIQGTNLTGLWAIEAAFNTTGKTKISSPTGTITARRPRISWDVVDGAEKYEIKLSRVGVAAPVIQRNDLNGSVFTPTSSLAAGTYRVWIRAIDGSLPGPWSSFIEFRIT
jgi:ELWxxDGT repeat protein